MKVQSKKYEGSYRRKPFLLLLFKKAKLVATERCFKIGVPKNICEGVHVLVKLQTLSLQLY